MADQRAPRTSHHAAFNSMCSLMLIRSLRHNPPHLLAFLCAPAPHALQQLTACFPRIGRRDRTCGADSPWAPCVSLLWGIASTTSVRIALRIVPTTGARVHSRSTSCPTLPCELLPPLNPTLCPRRVLPHLLRARHFQSHSTQDPARDQQRQQRQRQPRRQRHQRARGVCSMRTCDCKAGPKAGIAPAACIKTERKTY